jgi:hypothetical protein
MTCRTGNMQATDVGGGIVTVDVDDMAIVAIDGNGGAGAAAGAAGAAGDATTGDRLLSLRIVDTRGGVGALSERVPSGTTDVRVGDNVVKNESACGGCAARLNITAGTYQDSTSSWAINR